MFDQFVGTYSILRGSDSGVHAGIVESIDASAADGRLRIILKDGRRLHRWWAAEGVGLGGVAEKGLHPAKGDTIRIGVQATASYLVTQVSEIIPCSEIGEKSIRSAPAVQG